MIKILEILPNATDGTSFYRGRGPNSLLEKNNRDEIMFISANPNANIEWDNLLRVDMVFMQRPIYDVHVNTALRCRRLGIPLWVDYDDLLSEVPIDNQFHDQYEAFKKNLAPILNHADIISVSTEHLKDKLQEISPSDRYVVIPNALHPMFGKPNIQNVNDGVFWRGSPLHLKDLLDMKDIFKECFDSIDNRFTMIGYDPWFFREAGVNYESIAYGDMIEYFGTLALRQWGICVVTLHESDFNLAKSNIAWIEATYAGAMTIAPDFPEWRKPGIINYNPKDKRDFLNKVIFHAMRPTVDYWKESSDYIMKNLLLEDVNKLRYGIIKLLTNQKK